MSNSTCLPKSDDNIRLIDRLHCDDGSKRTIRDKFLSKFKAVNFDEYQAEAMIDASNTFVVLCTFQTRFEDSCNATMKEFQGCKSVVLVVFRRIIGSITEASIASGCSYCHPGVRKAIYAGFEDNKIHLSRTDEEFLEKELKGADQGLDVKNHPLPHKNKEITSAAGANNNQTIKKKESSVESSSIGFPKSVEHFCLMNRLYCDDGLKRIILDKFLSKFKAVTFVEYEENARKDASKPLIVLCTCQTKVEDSCNAAMEGIQDCTSVVLVVFRRIIGSVTKESIVCGCFYCHPGVRKTIYAGFDECKIYLSKTDKEFLREELTGKGGEESYTTR